MLKRHFGSRRRAAHQALGQLDGAGVRIGPYGEVAEGHGLAIIRISKLLATVPELGCEETCNAVDVPGERG